MEEKVIWMILLLVVITKCQQQSFKKTLEKLRKQHDKEYHSAVSKYLVELNTNELRSLKVNDFVYAFYPGSELSDRKYSRYKILADLTNCNKKKH